jgi:hypothetical protein
MPVFGCHFGSYNAEMILVLGLHGRFKDFPKEQGKHHQQHTLQHSESSDFDVWKRYKLRQELVLDDLNQYMSSVHFESKLPTKNGESPKDKVEESEKTSLTTSAGTYWELIRMLTDVEHFDDCMRLAKEGDPAKVDMMVGDIYGENSDALENPSLVAKQDPAEVLKQEDLARALLLMVTNNIGQVAYLNATLHKTPRIYFVESKI